MGDNTTIVADQASRPPTGRPWARWVKRGVVVALLAAVVAIQWPMLKGIVYGIAPLGEVSADQLPQWRTDYDAALAESRETGRPVLIDFTASWCPPCRVMERDVWPDPAVRQAIAARVVPLQLDIDLPGSAAAAQRYGIRYIPTIVLVDGQGNPLARTGFLDAGDLTEFITTHAPDSDSADDTPL